MSFFDVIAYVCIGIVLLLIVGLVVFLITEKNENEQEDGSQLDLLDEEKEFLKDKGLSLPGKFDFSSFLSEQKGKSINQPVYASPSFMSKDELHLMKECMSLVKEKQMGIMLHQIKEQDKFFDVLLDKLRREQDLSLRQRELDADCTQAIRYAQTFNVLCEIVMKNPALIALFRVLTDERCLRILGQIVGFSDKQYQANKPLLLEVVNVVKSAACA